MPREFARRSSPVNRHWTGFGQGIGPIAAGTGAVTLLPAAHDRETILRTRGGLLVNVDATQAPGGLASVSVGFILVPEGTSGTVLWSPTTDADAPWFFYWAGILGYEEMVTDVVDIPAMTAARVEIDSKAMRKIRNQEIQMVAENTTIGTALSITVAVIGRILTQE